MFILLPYQHDRMSVGRLPWVSIALLALNIFAFALTRGGAAESFHREEEALDSVYAYWAGNPFVKTTPAFDARFPKPVSGLRKAIGTSFEPPEADILAGQQAQFETLIAAALSAADSGPFGRWGFIPSHPSLTTLFTSQFIHAGWLHLLGNMLFLYLSAPFIENLWGRIVFPFFYLAGGAAAAGAQTLRFPDSTSALVGASGAIAAVMGAFLVCLGTTRIRFFWAWVTIGVRWGTFPAPAWLMLPLWLASQFVAASAAGGASGVAYWAHIGGFAFGASVAAALRFSGIEARRLRPAVEEASSSYGDARIDRGVALREAGNLPEAAEQFKVVLAANPGSTAAHEGAFVTAMLMSDMAGAAQHAAPLLEGHLKSGNTVAALQRYEEILQRLPDLALPARLLHALVVQEVKAGNVEAALGTCRRLAKEHPRDLLSLKGLLHVAKAANEEEMWRDAARESLAAAAGHPLATGEWAERIARLEAGKPTAAVHRGPAHR